MTTDHEIRVDGDRAWCRTCDWSDVTHGYLSALSWACLHFSDRRGTDGSASPAWTVCEFCAWPDRVWVGGRQDGVRGVTTWPNAATWEWDVGDLRRGRAWVLACEEHAHLGPSRGSGRYRQRLRLA